MSFQLGDLVTWKERDEELYRRGYGVHIRSFVGVIIGFLPYFRYEVEDVNYPGYGGILKHETELTRLDLQPQQEGSESQN
jgi:hypothetical protein